MRDAPASASAAHAATTTTASRPGVTSNCTRTGPLLAFAAPAVGHVRADLELPPLRPRSVDAVVCTRFLMHLPAASRPRVLGTLAALARGPLVATVCHPYTLKSLGRALRRALGGRAKRSPRLTRRALAGEVDAAGLELRRVIPVMPLLSEVWVVVVRKPASTS